MAPASGSNAGTVRTVIHQPVKNKETIGLYDGSTRATGPRIPPTAATQKYTPVRPVYDDFATAHSSITSGSALGRSKDILHKSPKKQTGLLERGRMLPKRTFKSLRRPKKQSKDEALAPPIPAKLSNHRPISEFDFDISNACFISSQRDESKPALDRFSNIASQKRTSITPFLDSIKKAMGGRSSPATESVQSRLSLSYKWPRDSMELSGLIRKVDQREEPDDDKKEIKSPQQSGRARLPELPSCIEDPFVLEASQNPKSAEQSGTGRNEAIPYSLHNRDSISSQANYGTSAIPETSHNEATVPIQDSLSYFHGGIALAIDSNETLSTQESSTVDNIVTQYARNNGLWDVSLDSNGEDSGEENDSFRRGKTQRRVQNDVFGSSVSRVGERVEGKDQLAGHTNYGKPFRAFKLLESSGSAPGDALPQIPSLADQRIIKSTSEGLGQSSSYGDTRNLLDITQRSQSGSATGPKIRAVANLRPSHLAAPSSTNPFRRGPDQNLIIPSIAAADSSPNSRLSHKMATSTRDSTEKLSGMPMFDLERSISLALRRMSAFSNSSQEIPAHWQGDGGFQSSTDSSGLLSYIGKPIQSAPEPPKLATQGFYLESAIRQNWLDSQRIELVRIPIHHDLSASSSIPASYSASSAIEEFDPQELDVLDQKSTEWETVVDGVVSRVRTAGSSLANNSSAGNISPILYQHDDFSSTDRIIQHPAQIEYSHDYRYREIKEGNFPILLPSYKPHTINGFPANSYRSIHPFQPPSGDIYEPPPPLSRSHTNPFRSPPPEVITTKSKSSEDVDQDKYLVDQPLKLELGLLPLITTVDHLDHWMDGFGDPGPAIRPTPPNPNPGAINHSEYSISESCSASQIVGSSIAGVSSSALGTIIHESEIPQEVEKYGALKSGHVAGYIDGVPPVARERAPFIKGPPGAFYQGVRSQPNNLRKNLFADHDVVKRLHRGKVAPKYPTNQMRPLSLLKFQCAEPVAGDIRSPALAPIKSTSWSSLYTKDQLNSMHDTAKLDRINDFEYVPWRSSRLASSEALKSNGSAKRTWSPHLRPWPRDNSSIKTDLSGRKVKISSLVFGLCCLFPPMLVLYGVGYLDNMMLWITDGEISSFSKGHKQAALRVVCLFIVSILIAVPIIIAVKVIGSK